MDKTLSMGLMVLLASSCNGLAVIQPRAVPDPKMVLYRLGDVDVAPVAGDPASVVVGVRPFTAVPELAGDALVAFSSPVEVQRAIQHSWVSGLRQVVTDATIRGLDRARVFERVGPASAMPHATLHLQGHILGFHEEDSPEGVSAVVRLRLELASADTHVTLGPPVVVEARRRVEAADADGRWVALVGGLGEALGEALSNAAPSLREQLRY